MSRTKLRIGRTEADNLVANLRGEVGEVTTSWVLMHHLMLQAKALRSGDPRSDLENEHLSKGKLELA